MNCSDGTVLSEHQCGSVMYVPGTCVTRTPLIRFCRGCATVSAKKELVIIDNATNGFTLYPLDSGNAIRTFFTDPPSVPVPKQVSFGEESRVVIGGSDSGVVYVFERRSGQLLEKIAHAATGLVQTISVSQTSNHLSRLTILKVRDVGGRCIIASASPALGRRKALVRVWVHQYGVTKDPKCGTGSDQLSFKWILKILFTSLAALTMFAATGSWMQKNSVSRDHRTQTYKLRCL